MRVLGTPSEALEFQSVLFSQVDFEDTEGESADIVILFPLSPLLLPFKVLHGFVVFRKEFRRVCAL